MDEKMVKCVNDIDDMSTCVALTTTKVAKKKLFALSFPYYMRSVSAIYRTGESGYGYKSSNTHRLQ